MDANLVESRVLGALKSQEDNFEALIKKLENRGVRMEELEHENIKRE